MTIFTHLFKLNHILSSRAPDWIFIPSNPNYHRNNTLVRFMITSTLYTTHFPYLSYICMLQKGHCIVPGQVTLLNDPQSFCYIECSNCHRQMTTATKQEFTCHLCCKKKACPTNVPNYSSFTIIFQL